MNIKLHYPWIALAGWMAGNALAADIELTTRVSGVVEEVYVKPGQSVKKGAVLLRLNKIIYQAQVLEAGAESERLRAEAAEAKRNLDRAEELYSRTVSSTTELDSAKLRHTQAQSALTIAEARATIAKKNLADADLKAPFNGVVAAVPAAPGVVVASDCQPRALVVMRR